MISSYWKSAVLLRRCVRNYELYFSSAIFEECNCDKRIMNLAVILNIALTALLIYLGICVAYYFIQEKFIFVPVHTDNFSKRKLTVPFEEVFLDTPNKGRIHGLLLKSPTPEGVVFYLHGNTGNIKRWRYKAEDICKLGFDVFVLDYRGFGESRGKRSEGIMHRDVEFCYDYILSRYAIPVIIYGRSLGCAFASKLASRREADKLVLETPFNNLLDIGRYYMPFLPIKFLLRYRFRSDIYIKQVKCPIHIFHGTNDIIVPYSSALKLYNNAKLHNDNVNMTTIKKGSHSNLKKFKLFRTRLAEFLY